MGSNRALPKLPKIGVSRYLTVIFLIGLLNASVGYAYIEAKELGDYRAAHRRCTG